MPPCTPPIRGAVATSQNLSAFVSNKNPAKPNQGIMAKDPMGVRGFCGSEDMKAMLKRGVSYSCEYRDPIGDMKTNRHWRFERAGAQRASPFEHQSRRQILDPHQVEVETSAALFNHGLAKLGRGLISAQP
jgi:hypothetical protein